MNYLQLPTSYFSSRKDCLMGLLHQHYNEVKKTPTSRSQWGFTETKSNQADLEKFTVCVMGSTRIKEKSCRVDALHMRYRGREFESLLVKPNPPS